MPNQNSAVLEAMPPGAKPSLIWMTVGGIFILGLPLCSWLLAACLLLDSCRSSTLFGVGIFCRKLVF